MENTVGNVIDTAEIKRRIDNVNHEEVRESLKRILIFLSSLLSNKLNSFKTIQEDIQHEFEELDKGNTPPEIVSINISGLGTLYNEVASEIKNCCQILGLEFKQLNIGDEKLWNSFQELIDATQHSAKELNEFATELVHLKKEDKEEEA